MDPVYIELGFDHILDPQGYDHILFVIALCSIFTWRDWKKIVVLVTAFTVGHSVTLLLSGLKIINVDAGLVETLIPITILATAILHLVKRDHSQISLRLNYGLAFSFGLIHGLGFSNFFKSLMPGTESIVWPLLNFNIGVELGQLLIVVGYMLLTFLLIKAFGFCEKYINPTISILIILESLRMLLV